MAKRFEQAKRYTEKYGALLRACQYCGSNNIQFASDRGMFPPRNEWSICCQTKNCDFVSGYTSIKEAITAWNRDRENEE